MFLYHIRRKGMSVEEGYIGITTNATRRFSQHSRDSKNMNRQNRNYHLYNAMRCYEDIEFVILEEGDDDYIINREFELRPLPDIGWNMAVGGSHNSCNIWKGKKRPEHSEAMKINGFQKGNKSGSFHPIKADNLIFLNKQIAAKFLGINPKTIYNRCKRGIDGYEFIRFEE